MPRDAYDPFAKTLHWISALAVLSLIAVGWWMTGIPLKDFELKLSVYNWHKWVGLLVLAVTLVRLLWRWRSPPPPFPQAIPPWERTLARIGHGALLLLLLAMPLSGWSMSSAAGVSVVWFGVVALPDLVSRDQELFEALRTTHEVLSKLLVAAIVLHLAAVARHDVLRRDGVLRRMLPFAR